MEVWACAVQVGVPYIARWLSHDLLHVFTCVCSPQEQRRT